MFYQALKYLFVFSFVCIANKTYSQWSSVGGGMNSNVYAMTVDTVNNELYVGGWFTTAGGIPAGHIAKWDGTNWFDIGGGMGYDFSDDVRCIVFYNGELYAGGYFDSAGSVAASNIAKWNGTNWSNVGAGFNSFVHSMVVYNGELYAAGEFDSSGTNAVNNIAKWDGTNWVDIGFGNNLAILTLCVYNNELHVGGSFLLPGGISTGNVAKWNGSVWDSVGGGMAKMVRVLSDNNGELYAGGDFIAAGGNSSVRYISKLVNNVWQALPYPSGGGIYNTVRDIKEFNGELYVTGRFTNVPYIGKFNGLIYYSLGSGLSGTGECLAVYKNELYVGGYFSSAIGVTNTVCIAKWNPAVGEFENISPSVAVGPNPFDNYTVFQMPNNKNSERNLSVYDLLGNLVREEQIGFENEFRFNRENLVNGVYLYRVCDVNGLVLARGKLMIVD